MDCQWIFYSIKRVDASVTYCKVFAIGSLNILKIGIDPFPPYFTSDIEGFLPTQSCLKGALQALVCHRYSNDREFLFFQRIRFKPDGSRIGLANDPCMPVIAIAGKRTETDLGLRSIQIKDLVVNL